MPCDERSFARMSHLGFCRGQNCNILTLLKGVQCTDKVFPFNLQASLKPQILYPDPFPHSKPMLTVPNCARVALQYLAVTLELDSQSFGINWFAFVICKSGLAEQDSVRLLAVNGCGQLARLLPRDTTIDSIVPLLKQFSAVSIYTTLRLNAMCPPCTQFSVLMAKTKYCVQRLQSSAKRGNSMKLSTYCRTNLGE